MKKIKDFSLREKLGIVERYNKGENASQISSSLGVNRQNLVYFLRKEPSVKWRGRRTFVFDEDYFKEIDTEQKAYFLGFLFADGHNCVGKYISMDLQFRDRRILEKFSKALKYEGPIFDRERNDSLYSRLRVSSKKLSHDLLKYGMIQNKTVNPLVFPNIRVDLMWHFLRGLSDGDGSIRSDQEQTTKRFSWILSGNKTMCIQIREYFLTCGFNSSIHEYDNYSMLRVDGNNQVEKLLSCLYSNASIYLERKKKQFLFIQKHQECHNKDSSKKLSNDQILEIRFRAGKGDETFRQISRDYGVNSATVWSVAKNKTYKEV